MYSLVLMTALTGGPDTMEFNGSGIFPNMFSGGSGCSGSSCSGNCYGNYAPRYSCYGGGCSSASATPANCSGCSGCSGSSSSPSLGERVRKWFDRGNCSGSCQGCTGSGCRGSGYGCTGSGYGCTGSGYGCTGSGYGCTGSGSGCTGSGYGCTGSMAYSCFGSSAYSCFGGPAVAYTPMFNGGLSCQTGIALPAPPPVFDSTPGMIPPTMGPPATIPFAPPEAAPGLNPQNTGFRPTPENGTALVSNGATARATVVVRLPADARLFAESKALNLTGSERKFVSPELPIGQEFVYRFRVEYERDGESVSVTKKVPIRAGGQFAVEFTDLTAKAVPEKAVPEKSASVAAVPTSNPVHTTPVPPVVSAPQNPAVPSVSPSPTEPAGGSDRAMITVKLPPGATLFVDDRKSPSNDPVRRFNTPPLPAGRDFAYLMRAEIVRNGQTESFTQKVPFRAGERVEVDFTSSGR